MISTIFISACDFSTELEKSQRLIIENGFFSKLESSNLNRNKYLLEYDFYVTNEKCNIGGHGIQFDSVNSFREFWYKLITINHDQKYSRSDTITTSFEQKTNPIIKMQGYKIGEFESPAELFAEYELKLK